MTRTDIEELFGVLYTISAMIAFYLHHPVVGWFSVVMAAIGYAAATWWFFKDRRQP